jgi:hypothetical protein
VISSRMPYVTCPGHPPHALAHTHRKWTL